MKEVRNQNEKGAGLQKANRESTGLGLKGYSSYLENQYLSSVTNGESESAHLPKGTRLV